jgi:hypothetical protein
VELSAPLDESMTLSFDGLKLGPSIFEFGVGAVELS